jgi:hypothetical protein
MKDRFKIIKSSTCQTFVGEKIYQLYSIWDFQDKRFVSPQGTRANLKGILRMFQEGKFTPDDTYESIGKVN